MKNLKEIKFMMERIESPRLTDVEYQHRKKALIKESNEEQDAVKKAMSIGSTLNKSQELDKLAEKITSDPKLLKQLEAAVKNAGVDITLTENEGQVLDNEDMKKMVTTLMDKSSSLDEGMSSDPNEDDTSAGLSMASFIGGGFLGANFSSAIISAVPAAASIIVGPALIGAVAGVALFVLARKVYLKLSDTSRTNTIKKNRELPEM
jgi:hypothetical protein